MHYEQHNDAAGSAFTLYQGSWLGISMACVCSPCVCAGFLKVQKHEVKADLTYQAKQRRL